MNRLYIVLVFMIMSCKSSITTDLLENITIENNAAIVFEEIGGNTYLIHEKEILKGLKDESRLQITTDSEIYGTPDGIISIYENGKFKDVYYLRNKSDLKDSLDLKLFGIPVVKSNQSNNALYTTQKHSYVSKNEGVLTNYSAMYLGNNRLLLNGSLYKMKANSPLTELQKAYQLTQITSMQEMKLEFEGEIKNGEMELTDWMKLNDRPKCVILENCIENSKTIFSNINEFNLKKIDSAAIYKIDQFAIEPVYNKSYKNYKLSKNETENIIKLLKDSTMFRGGPPLSFLYTSVIEFYYKDKVNKLLVAPHSHKVFAEDFEIPHNKKQILEDIGGAVAFPFVKQEFIDALNQLENKTE